MTATISKEWRGRRSGGDSASDQESGGNSHVRLVGRQLATSDCELKDCLLERVFFFFFFFVSVLRVTASLNFNFEESLDNE